MSKLGVGWDAGEGDGDDDGGLDHASIRRGTVTMMTDRMDVPDLVCSSPFLSPFPTILELPMTMASSPSGRTSSRMRS
jgi:hypothetical protein